MSVRYLKLFLTLITYTTIYTSTDTLKHEHFTQQTKKASIQNFSNNTITLEALLQTDDHILITNSRMILNTLTKIYFNKSITIKDCILELKDFELNFIQKEPILILKYYFNNNILPHFKTSQFELINVRLR
jgi:hypothetical protein